MSRQFHWMGVWRATGQGVLCGKDRRASKQNTALCRAYRHALQDARVVNARVCLRVCFATHSVPS